MPSPGLRLWALGKGSRRSGQAGDGELPWRAPRDMGRVLAWHCAGEAQKALGSLLLLRWGMAGGIPLGLFGLVAAMRR